MGNQNRQLIFLLCSNKFDWAILSNKHHMFPSDDSLLCWTLWNTVFEPLTLSFIRALPKPLCELFHS